MNKKHTIEEKIKICENAVLAKVEGTSASKFAESLDITDTTLRTWLKEYAAGELKGESENDKVPDELSELVSEEINGPTEPKQLDIVVVIDDNTEKPMKVDDPGLQNYEDKIAAIKERVFSQFEIFIKV